MGEYKEAILKFAKKKRNKIGVSVLHISDELISNLEKASEYADVIIFSKEIRSFECYSVDCNSLEDESKVSSVLFKAYKEKRIDGFIRGHLKYDQFYDEMQKIFGVKYEDIAPIMKTADGKEFGIGPGIMTFGHKIEEKLEFALKAAAYFKRFGINLSFGVLGGDFSEDKGHNVILDNTIEDAEKLVELLREKGHHATYYAHRIENAIDNSNFIIPINGIFGNLIYRLLFYHGKAEELGEAVFCNENIGENSRYTDKLANNIIFANAVVNTAP